MQTALIIGDSHADATDAYLNSKTACFGTALASRLVAQGYEVTLAGVGGSTVADWLTPKVCRPGKCVVTTGLPTAPDLLLVVLGSNDMGKGGDAAATVAAFPALVSRFVPKRAIWIGPPAMRGTTGYSDANMAKLYDAAASAGVPIFDSRVPTAPAVEAGDGDGIHSGPASAAAWADAVASVAGGGSSGPPWLLLGGAALCVLALVLVSKRK